MGIVDLDGLNEEQKEAVLTTEGPLLLIAGPGTGKTHTLVQRIVYLVLEKNVSLNEIMVVTFTEKAAKELVTRISNEFLKYDVYLNINEMYIGTFHAVCLRLLKEYLEYSEDNERTRMLDAFEQVYLICRNLDIFNVLPGFSERITSPFGKGLWGQAMEICRYVNLMMEELVDLEKMADDPDEDMRFMAKLVDRYKKLLERDGSMDFSMIQTKTYELFMMHSDLLEKIQSQIRYIMVDEYQDTNYIQEQLVLLISGERKNICVVGDDDQGMYRFRGATIRNILEFPKHFPGGVCRTVHLNTNYRSEPEIIDFYNRWMEEVAGINLFNWDCYRYPKEIVSGKTEVSGDHAVFACGGSVEEEKKDILDLIRQLQENENISNLNQVAVLFRSVKGSEAKEVAEYLEENGIPVYSPRSEMFFQREEVKQLLGCMMLCFPYYVADLKNNSFVHRISDELRSYYIQCVKAANVLQKQNEDLHTWLNRLQQEISEVDASKEIGLLDIMYRLFSFAPFSTCLDADLKDHIQKTRAARNLAEVSRMIAKYNRLHNMHFLDERNRVALPEEWFNIYLKYMYIDGIGEYEDESEYAPSGCVSFMTIHQSKGLEFPAVIVGSIGAAPRRNRDILLQTAETRFFHRPPYEPLADIKYFDFWRLYYVAFSRAQNLLVLASKKDESKYFDDHLRNLPHIRELTRTDRFENVKKIRYKRMYSFTSHIAIYDGCPSQYKFYKEYGFAQNKMFHTSVGSLVHATLEDMNKCAIAGHAERITEDNIREWFILNFRRMQEDTGYSLTEEQKKNALNQVIRYFNHRQKELGKAWKAEEEINLILPEFILQGIIDLVEGDGDALEIVDYKTGIKPDITGRPERVEHYRKQLEIYAYLVEKQYQRKVNRMHLYYTSTVEGDPLITFQYSRQSVDGAIREVHDTVRAIEDKEFDDKVQNTYACEFCDMKYYCGVASC